MEGNVVLETFIGNWTPACYIYARAGATPPGKSAKSGRCVVGYSGGTGLGDPICIREWSGAYRHFHRCCTVYTAAVGRPGNRPQSRFRVSA